MNIHWKDWCYVLWPPEAKGRLIGKDPDAGKEWRQEEKGIADDEMVGWPYQLSGHESEQTPRDREGQGSLACCSPWGHKKSDTTEQLNNNNSNSLPRVYFWGKHKISSTPKTQNGYYWQNKSKKRVQADKIRPASYNSFQLGFDKWLQHKSPCATD